MFNLSSESRARRGGFTLLEVSVAMGLATLMIAGILQGYSVASRKAEWSSYSLAAQSMAIKGLERAVAAPWRENGADQLVSSNFPPSAAYLCLPTQQTNLLSATNFTTIRTISTTPPLKMVQVECRWSFMNRAVFSNTVATIRAPNL